MSKTETPEILTPEGVAALLLVSPRQVRRLAASGRLPSFRVGAYLRFRRSVVLDWIAAQERAA